MNTEHDHLNTVKALEHVKSEGSLTGALAKSNGEKRPSKGKDKFELPPIEAFRKILKKAGVTEKYVANKLFELFEATNVSVDRQGKIHESPNHTIRMKAIELWLKYYVPLESNKGDNNHLHLHGDKKVNELLNKARNS